MQISDFEEKKVKNTIRKMAQVLSFAFSDKTDLYIGFYALLTAKMLICRYFDEDCEDIIEFQNVRCCLLNTLSDFTKTMYAQKIKGEK